MTDRRRKPNPAWQTDLYPDELSEVETLHARRDALAEEKRRISFELMRLAQLACARRKRRLKK